MVDPQLIASLGPPLIGTLAGYTASRLAIFLLFKPRRPWRLFGLTLPFTPGAFAAGRHHLAAAIGERVGSDLLSREEIDAVLADPHFAEDLRHTIETRLAELLDHDLGPAASLVPSRFRGVYEMGGKVLRLRSQQLLHHHLDSPAFAENLRQELSRQGMAADTTEIENLIALIRSPQGKRLLDTLLAQLLTDRVLAQPIGPLANLVPAEVQQGLTTLLLREVRTLLIREIPALFATMNIKTMAAQRVEEIAPREYEAMLRRTMARRTNSIALLGALLGLGLGLVALLLLPPS